MPGVISYWEKIRRYAICIGLRALYVCIGKLSDKKIIIQNPDLKSKTQKPNPISLKFPKC